jgi:hypothetical protein
MCKNFESFRLDKFVIDQKIVQELDNICKSKNLVQYLTVI